MTMHADQLVGAPVVDSDGRGVGTVEQVFRDDVDGTPSWARIRSARGLHFVPLAGGKVTGNGGLSVAFDEQKILSEPDFNVDRHMSVDQEEELRQYFGLGVPAQAGKAGAGKPEPRKPEAGKPGSGRPEDGRPGAARPEAGQAGRVTPPMAGQPTVRQAVAGQPGGVGQPGGAGQPGGVGQPGRPGAPGQGQPGQPQPGRPAGSGETRVDRQSPPAADQPAQQWMIRSEERFSVNLETQEASRVRLRKYVETEPVEQTVKVFHEEYEIERVPIAKDDQVRADLAEGEQEVILREARAIITKESVPVERVRLTARKIEEDKTVRDELRRERIEILGDPDRGVGGGGGGGQAMRSAAQSPAGQRPAGQSPAGQSRAGQRPAGQSPGQPPAGRPASGQSPGQSPAGQRPSGQPPSGQPASAPPPSGQPGQTPAGQPPSSQPPSGQARR